MKPVQKLWVAAIVGMTAVAGHAAPRQGNGQLVAGPGDTAPAAGAPGMGGYPAGNQSGAAAPVNPRADPAPMGMAAEMSGATSDRAITMNVKSQLLAEKGLTSSGIQVSTQDGVVRLSGTVKNDSERLTALNATRSVAGVKSVEDAMRVGK